MIDNNDIIVHKSLFESESDGVKERKQPRIYYGTCFLFLVLANIFFSSVDMANLKTKWSVYELYDFFIQSFFHMCLFGFEIITGLFSTKFFTMRGINAR